MHMKTNILKSEFGIPFFVKDKLKQNKIIWFTLLFMDDLEKKSPKFNRIYTHKNVHRFLNLSLK